MEDIVVVGIGGFGREVKTLIDDINKTGKKYNFLGFYDDAFTEKQIVNGFPVLGSLDDLATIKKNTSVAIGVGNPETKGKIVSLLQQNNYISFPVLIHPSAIISNDNITIGKGTIICAGCIITCDIQVKEFVTLNLMCTIGHDSIIENYVSIMPGVNISGEVTIKESCYIGTGAKIINMLEIGKNTIIGAGAVVSKTIPENCTAVGIPAKPIKFHE